MLKQKFFQELRSLIDRVEKTQDNAIERTAEAMANAVAKGNCIHIYDTGHMLSSELINRAGGMYGFKALNINFSVENLIRPRPEDKTKDRNLEGFMRYALKTSNLQPGDVLVVGSVSGKSVFPVDIALIAKEMGATVVAMTSVTYSSMLKSEHSTGKRLFEVADIVIDNCAPPLDAMVEVPGQDITMCPASGISAATIMWAVEAHLVELLLARGVKPTILKSINFPGSEEYNNAEYQRYNETGH